MLQKAYVFGLGSYLIEAFKFGEDQKKTMFTPTFLDNETKAHKIVRDVISDLIKTSSSSKCTKTNKLAFKLGQENIRM